MKLLRSSKSTDHADNKAEVIKTDAVSQKSAKSKRSLRSGKSKKAKQAPEAAPASKEESWWNEPDADAKSDMSSSTAYSWREKAIAQRNISYDHFGDFPKEVLSLNMTPKPEVLNSTDVLIKVEVRVPSYMRRIMLDIMICMTLTRILLYLFFRHRQ